MPLPRMYTELAPWFHLLTAPHDYAEEAALYAPILASAEGGTRAVLELGSGGGNNASHLKAHFELTLVDLSPSMMAISRELNPGIEHIEGDMRTLRLGREFDAVFIHDAIAYMTSAADLRATMATAFAHCRPGGVALFVPDCTRETLIPGTDHGGYDDLDGRGVRYLEWTHAPAEGATSYRVDYGIMTRDVDGSVNLCCDVHGCGIFGEAEWLEWMRAAGFDAQYEHHAMSDGSPIELFIGRRPG